MEITHEDDFIFFVPDEEVVEKKDRPKVVPEQYASFLKKKEVKPIPRPPEEWAKIFEPYPVMPDGYMKAFDHTEVDQYKAALEKYGFVVIKLLEAEQCEKTIEEFFWDINRRAKNQKMEIKRDEPWTWETCNWPQERRTKFLMTAPALGPRAFENRTSPILYDIYCNLLNTTELWCNIDNWGCFRGTKNLRWKTEDGQEIVRDRDDWRYSLLLHWDVNPWVLQKWKDEGDPELYQGVVALNDCSDEVGSFMAVPGSHTFMSQWIKEHPCPYMTRDSLRPPADDPMQQYKQRVPLRRGEMVIWYTRTAHCNFPNNSSKMRHIQYVRCLPATPQSQDKDRYASRRIMRKWRADEHTDWNLPHLTPLGRKMVGKENWDGSEYIPPVYPIIKKPNKVKPIRQKETTEDDENDTM